MRNTLSFDVRMHDAGGIGTYIKEILPYLVDAFQLTLITDVPLFEWDVRQVICEAKIYSVGEQIMLPLKIPKCDYFFSPHFNIPLMPIRAKRRIVTIHDVFHLAHLSLLSSKEKIYAKTIISSCVRKSDLIFTDSHFSFDEIVSHTNVNSEKLRMIHLAHRSSGTETGIAELIGKYSLPKEYFLFVGNVKPHKNLRGLLQAYLKQEDLPDLIVVGKKEGFLNGDSIHEIQKQHPELKNKIHLLGKVPDADLPGLYQNALSLVFPSFYEGFGLPPLEAMYYGCPAIVSKRASIPEVCGDAAYYIDPDDSCSILSAMLQLWRDSSLRTGYIEKGKDQAIKFSWENTASKIIDEIQGLT